MRPLLFIALAGCASDYTFSDRVEEQPDVPAATAASAPRQAPAPKADPVRFERVDVAQGPTSAVFAREDVAQGIREESFAAGGGASTAVTDYLFVIDNSTSMNKVLDNVRAGMLSLAEDGVFPSKARIAVMTSLPGDPADLSRPHASATLSRGLAQDPGFLTLVDGESIAAYRGVAPEAVVANFPLDGCSAWFSPTDTNAAGAPCIAANTQIGMTALGVEAGLVAFRQLVESAESPVFRPGAAVNVIFVSDTHDPGLPLDAPGVANLVELRPDFALLQELVAENSLVSSFRVHAIAPARPCVEKWSDGPTYREATRDSSGVFLDVCTAADYRPMIEKIAKQGAVVQQPVFPLGRNATAVESVLVDGRPVGFSVSADGGVLVLDEALPKRRSRVGVRYHFDR